MTVSRNAAAQTAIAATNAESNARPFLGSSRDSSHEHSYVRMLAIIPFSKSKIGHSIGDRCDRDHTARSGFAPNHWGVGQAAATRIESTVGCGLARQ
jgi:hypothetical protein